MARVHDVDPNVIARTQRWLAGKQKADGSWEETNQGIAEGIINRQTGACERRPMSPGPWPKAATTAANWRAASAMSRRIWAKPKTPTRWPSS